MIANWKHSEPAFADASTKFGSGYPSDPTCKTWMKDNLSNPIFGFTDAVRFSWGPAKKMLEEDGVPVKFAADEDVDEHDGENKHKILLGRKRQQEQMTSFLTSGKSTKQKRLPYFERRKLLPVTKF
jgi:hypothetical protein